MCPAGDTPAAIDAGSRLTLGEPFDAPYSELVAPATLEDGTEAVLKIQFRDDVGGAHEAYALGFWAGRGAVRLLAHDPAQRAFVIERCLPGTPLGTVYDDEALAIAAAVMQRLWRPPSHDVPWRRLASVAQQWLDDLPRRYERLGRPCERTLFDEAVEAIRTLGPSQEDVVLCHNDLHGGNILRAEREPWLAIDPKPIVAERAYDTVAIVRDGPLERLTVAEIRRRADAFAELLGIDRDRIRGWAIATQIVGGLRADVREEDLELARRIARAFG